jgi:methionyl-tRNA formyltransferase
MQVVSFGFQTWVFSTRQALIELGHEAAVAVHSAVEQLARDHGIPEHLTERVHATTIDLVERVPRTESSPAAMNSSCAGGYLNDRA